MYRTSNLGVLHAIRAWRSIAIAKARIDQKKRENEKWVQDMLNVISHLQSKREERAGKK